MPKLEQYSIVDYVASDRDLLKCSSSLHVDSVDIGTSDHLLLWRVELRKVRKAKNSKRKRVIYQWRVDSLKDKKLREKYQESLESEVDIFVKKLSNYRKSSTLNVESVRKLREVRKAKNSKRKRGIYQWRVDSLKDKKL